MAETPVLPNPGEISPLRNPTEPVQTPQQLDAEAFRLGAGDFRQGVRSGFNQLGAMTNAFAANLGQTMGLSDFAATRFADAAQYADFADAVAPEVRDYRAVKDFDTLTGYIAGLAGQGVASFAPAAVGGLVGAKVGGLRGAYVGLGAGSFVPNAGEQAMRVKDLPGTAGQKTENMLGVGAVNAALDVVAPGGVAKKLAGPAARVGLKEAAKGVGKTTLAEGATEGLQEVVGQQGERQLDPARSTAGDVPDIINAVAGGAVGGATLGGAGHVASLAKRGPEALAGALKTNSPVVDDGDLSAITAMKTDNPEEILAAIDGQEEKSKASLEKVWEKVGGDKAWEKFKDWRDDPEVFQNFKEAAKQRYNDLEIGPRVKGAFDRMKASFTSNAPEGGEKKSLQRTAIDANILDFVTKQLPEHVRENLTPEQRIELAGQMKDYAMHGFGRRTQEVGPQPGAESTAYTRASDIPRTRATEAGQTREQDRPTQAERIPNELLHMFGGNTVGTLQGIHDILKSSGVRVNPRDFPAAQKEAATQLRGRNSRLDAVIHQNMKDDLYADKDMRKTATEGFKRMLDSVQGNSPEEMRALTGHAEKQGNEGQRLSAHGQNLMEAAGYIFKDKGEAMRAIEALQQNDPFAREFHLSQDEVDDIEPQLGAGDQAAQSHPDEFGPPSSGHEAYSDARLDQVHPTVESAKKTYDALTSEYDADKVRFETHEQVDENGRNTGRYVITAKDAEASDTLSKAQWKRLTPGSNQSGFENSVITVRTKDAPGGKKVDIRALTAEAMRSIDAPGKRSLPYVADMVQRGLAMLLGDKNVTGLGQKTTEQIDTKDPSSWDIPADTVVATHGGRSYTWGDVKRMSTVSHDELKMRRMVDNPLEAAQQADSVDEIENTVLPWMDARLDELRADLDVARANSKARPRDDKAKTAYQAALSRYNRMAGGVEKVEAEVDRRKREGDKPFGDIGAKNVDDQMLESNDTAKSQDRPGDRNVQEETGLALRGKPGKGPVGELATGIKAEDKAPSTPKITKPTEEPKLVPSVELERAFRAWQEKNPGKPIGDYLRELLQYTGGSKKTLALRSEAAKLSRQAQGLKFSDLRMGDQNVTDKQKAEVRAEVDRLLGDTAIALFKNLDHAGSFANIKGVEVLKIANLALDPLGTARHEAAHALMARLLQADKDAAHTLLAAAGSPSVVSQLRTLLKGHPEAIKQLTDSEERLAYMYQFWAAGQLDVGPKTKTWFDKVKNFFRTVAGFWSETFHDQQSVEKAEKVFELFDRGDLSDRNTVAEVLRDKLPKTPFDRATELMGPAWSFLDKAFSTSDGFVRGMKIPALTAEADKFFSPLGKQDAKPGFNQAKHVAANTYLNQLHDALAGTSEAGRRDALEALQSGEAPKTAEAKRVVEKVRPLLKNMFDYMDKKGVKAVVWNEGAKKYDEHDLKFVENYFPRYYDKQHIMENRKAFDTMLEKNGFKRKEAGELFDRLTRSTKADPQENDEQVGLTFYAPNTQSRKLDIPAKELAPFLRKDLYGTLASYITYATRRGEYASRFGNQGQTIEAAVRQAIEKEGAKPEQIRGFTDAVKAWEGSIGNNISPELRKIFGAAVTYQNVRLLPLALFSSLVDPLGIAVRGGTMGEAFGAFVRGVRELAGQHEDEAFELAKLAGSIATAHDSHMLADAYGSQYMTPWQQRINQFFFKWNGLESWNRSMRVAATAAAEQFIIRHATKPNEHSERYLSELGLTKGDVKAKDGRLDLSDQKVKDALNLWVDGAVLRPNAAVRPIWMSDPRWMLVSHLKQFTYSFQKTIIARVVHELEHGNTSSAYALLSYVPTIIAADMLRAMLTPGGADDDRLEKMGLAGVLGRGVQRAGLFGPGQYALDAYGDMGHAKAPVVSLAGPTAQQVYDMGAAAAGRGQGTVGQELAKAIPGYVLVK